jgi:hypothetical protein
VGVMGTLQHLRDIKQNETIRVHLNLNKNKFTVSAKSNGRYYVISYVNNIVLEDVTFYVKEGLRQRVLREKVKNVHAGVQGQYVSSDTDVSIFTPIHEIYYSPYTTPFFIDLNTKEKMEYVSKMLLVDGKMYSII